MREDIKTVLGWYPVGVLTAEDALRALKLTSVDEPLAKVDEASFERPESYRPTKVKSDIDKAVEAAWLALDFQWCWMRVCVEQDRLVMVNGNGSKMPEFAGGRNDDT